MTGTWSQAGQAFMTAMAGMSAPSQISIWVGVAVALVMAAEGLLVSFFPRVVFRRMRILPPGPRQEDQDDDTASHRDGRIEPSFQAPLSASRTRPLISTRRAVLRARPSLKIVGKNTSEN